VPGQGDWIEPFLEGEKRISQRVRWTTKGRADHAEARAKVVLRRGRTLIRGKLVIVAHRNLQPPKYGFSLLLEGKRILGLDVNPKRSHRNILTGKSVTQTHWQRYPLMEAELDSRDLPFQEWLEAFLARANIVTSHRIASPPTGEQLELEFIPWKR
jgi:hypothetical protein